MFPAIYFHPRLANVGSESAKDIGKQPGAKRPERASSVQQSSASDSGVSVRSWSRNWPNCITIRVACKFGQKLCEQLHILPVIPQKNSSLTVLSSFVILGWNSMLTLLAFGSGEAGSLLHWPS